MQLHIQFVCIHSSFNASQSNTHGQKARMHIAVHSVLYVFIFYFFSTPATLLDVPCMLSVQHQTEATYDFTYTYIQHTYSSCPLPSSSQRLDFPPHIHTYIHTHIHTQTQLDSIQPFVSRLFVYYVMYVCLLCTYIASN